MARRNLTIKDKVLASSVVDDNGCWRWQRPLSTQGYGFLGVRRQLGMVTTTAHRASYEVFRGDIPRGHDIDHLCRVRDCVNPDHLEAVSRAENLRRSPNVGKPTGSRHKSHCVRGHELTGDNLLIRDFPCGRRRFCRQCYLDGLKGSVSKYSAPARSSERAA